MEGGNANGSGVSSHAVKDRYAAFTIDTNTPHAPFIIGISGGTASGKTTVSESIIKRLSSERVVIVSQDSFYRNLTDEERERAANARYNFDHPDAFDRDLMVQVLQDLKARQSVSIPHYDFKTHSRTSKTSQIFGPDVVIFEGILVLYEKGLRDLMDLKIFVDTDADTRLARRVLRDIQERGRSLNGVLQQYTTFVKPAFDEFIFPTKQYADIIIPFHSRNDVAIVVLAQEISRRLAQLGSDKG